MRFLIDLFKWFVTGSSDEADVASSTVSENGSSIPEPAQVTKRNPFDVIDFDLNKGANISQFLNDIRSIEPISKEFSKARQEILEELKKLTPRKNT
jgi:hypothetical protein